MKKCRKRRRGAQGDTEAKDASWSVGDMAEDRGLVAEKHEVAWMGADVQR